MSDARVETRLKPCPFCGKTPTVEIDEAIGLVSIWCCVVEIYADRIGRKMNDAIDEAITTWNRRNGCMSIDESNDLKRSLNGKDE